MKTFTLGKSGLNSSRLVYGCMRIAGDGSAADREKGKAAIRAAIAAGYNHFDHADIYGGGACESLFGEVLQESPRLRDQLLITGKCGIRLADDPLPGAPKRYDFSRRYILDSIDGSLQRLGIECLDLFLLHRPDFLFDPKAVGATFRELREAGKVRHFGVSNFNPHKLEMLQAFCDEPLHANQVQINIDHLESLHDGTLDQCQRLAITPMAWCPLGGVAYPAWDGNLSEEQTRRVQSELQLQGEKYGAEPWVVVLAWLLRHPAGIAPIIGSTRPDRIAAATQALHIEYSTEDWYRLLEVRNGAEVA